MRLVDENNHVNFYDGKIRVTDQQGKEFTKFEAADYLDNICEHVEPWTYSKFTYLKEIGWKGFKDGPESGIYRVGPLGRLNAAEGMSTPLADKEYTRFYETLGGKPVKSTLAFHWARLIELLNASERAVELATDPRITDSDLRNPVGEPGEGVGVVEAARGTLYHHYKVDEEGMIEEANLVVATTNNYADICMSIRDAAKGLIKGNQVNEGLLNMVEMSFRAYDPCFGCSTHALPGEKPLKLNIYDHQKNHIKTVQRD
jgi:F420-non-reducing hydrogenase large subunit